MKLYAATTALILALSAAPRASAGKLVHFIVDDANVGTSRLLLVSAYSHLLHLSIIRFATRLAFDHPQITTRPAFVSSRRRTRGTRLSTPRVRGSLSTKMLAPSSSSMQLVHLSSQPRAASASTPQLPPRRWMSTELPTSAGTRLSPETPPSEELWT